jgi:DNA-binding LacI/PurR family transcriptional regulator
VKRPTIVDIAKRAGVSKGAVSFALNGQTGVSASTRKRVLAIAEEIGWSPNTVARTLSGASSNTIGMALRRPARVLGVEPFFMELISGVEAQLSARSYALTLQVVNDLAAEMELYRRWGAENRVDGVLLCDLQVSDPRIPVLEELDLPAVVIGSSAGSGSLISVGSDDAASVAEALEYLVSLGHRRIARVQVHPAVAEARDAGGVDARFELAAQSLDADRPDRQQPPVGQHFESLELGAEVLVLRRVALEEVVHPRVADEGALDG